VYETVSGVRSLKYIVTPEGRAVKSGSDWVYEYNLTDHLGNVRAVIRKGSNGLAELIQQKHYYPFGLEMSQLSLGTGTNKYLYNSKEIQDDFNLYWYDYGARFYDPQIGRWHSVDPLAEKNPWLSPYHFCSNNPINRLDPDGRDDFTVNKKTGDVTNIRGLNLYYFAKKGVPNIRSAPAGGFKAGNHETPQIPLFPKETLLYVGLGKSDSWWFLLLYNNHNNQGLPICSAGLRDFDFPSQILQNPLTLVYVTQRPHPLKAFN